MRGCSSALGHWLFALLQVLPSPWNTWSQDSSNTAQSFFSAAQEKNGFLTKTTSLSEEVMQRLKSITVMEWTQQKQIADTKINRGNVWLHSKLVPFLFLHSTRYCFIFCAFLCVLSPLDHSIYSFRTERPIQFSVSLSIIYLLSSGISRPCLPFFSHLIYLVSWKIFSSLLLTGHV